MLEMILDLFGVGFARDIALAWLIELGNWVIRVVTTLISLEAAEKCADRICNAFIMDSNYVMYQKGTVVKAV